MTESRSRPYDMAYADVEMIRRKRRMRLLKYAAAPILLLLSAALWLALPSIATNQAIGAFSRGSYDGARGWLNILVANDVYETYKLPFNQAITDVKRGDFSATDQLLDKATARAPDDKKCFVTLNHVLATEIHADSLTTPESVKDAIVLYTKALAMVSSHPDCFKNEDALKNRLIEKLTATIQKLADQQYRYTDKATQQQQVNTQEPSQQTQQQLKDLETQSRQTRNELIRKDAFDPNAQLLDKPW